MGTLVHDDTLFGGHPATPSKDDDKTLIRRCPGNPLAKHPPAASPEPDADNRPIAKLILAHDRSLTGLPASRSATRTASTEQTRGLPITVLTTDEAFAAQMRAALDDHDVLIVDDIDAAAERATAHQCPILVTDAAITRNSVEELSSRVRAHNQDVTIIASSNRDQGGLLIGLQSSGAIDGFLLKPVTTAAAELVIEAATRRHRTQTSTGAPTRMRAKTRPPRTQRTAHTSGSALATQTVVAARPPQQLEPPLPIPQAAARPSRPALPRASWPIVLAIALAVGGVTWRIASQREPAFDPNALIERHLTLADEAKLAGRLLDPRDGAVHHYQAVLAIDPQNLAAQRGLDRVAGELSKQTQAHMSAQRFTDAALALSRLRELQPDYPELPLLDDQLRELQAAIVAATPPTPAPPAPTDAKEAPKREKPIERTANDKPRATQQATKPVVQEQAQPKVLEQPVASTPLSEPIVQPPVPEPEIQAPTPIATPPDRSPSAAVTGVMERPPDRSPSAAVTGVMERPPVASNPPPFAPEALQPTSQAKPAQRALLTYVPPVYPREAFLRGIEGSITMSLQISDDGRVVDPRVESGNKRQLFARSALAAVRQWRYAPRDANTPPGNERIAVKVEFKLR